MWERETALGSKVICELDEAALVLEVSIEGLEKASGPEEAASREESSERRPDGDRHGGPGDPAGGVRV